MTAAELRELESLAGELSEIWTEITDINGMDAIVIVYRQGLAEGRAEDLPGADDDLYLHGHAWAKERLLELYDDNAQPMARMIAAWAEVRGLMRQLCEEGMLRRAA